MKDRILDLVFLVGVLFKGIDGVGELLGGAILLFIGPAQLKGMANAVTAHELSQDPDDTIANFIRHEAAHLDSNSVVFLAIYLLLHGIVKLAIVIALLVGSKRVYPWAIAALIAFVLFQLYELITAPSIGFVLLTVFDLVIIWLTWREWRRDRELRDTWRGTVDWVFRRRVAS
ncbi:DUF2127 domain-containing protein [Gryllotalpicola reticulitermitis]|uniref:DUF2127 domain-containing protein n=1 Tax=Gryllotalpicola reticulitermitis TaxID=1184153 RepID=A0ABV8Q6D3_9MICO